MLVPAIPVEPRTDLGQSVSGFSPMDAYSIQKLLNQLSRKNQHESLLLKKYLSWYFHRIQKERSSINRRTNDWTVHVAYDCGERGERARVSVRQNTKREANERLRSLKCTMLTKNPFIILTRFDTNLMKQSIYVFMITLVMIWLNCTCSLSCISTLVWWKASEVWSHRAEDVLSRMTLEWFDKVSLR